MDCTAFIALPAMDLPDDSPRLPKLPFLLGDIALLSFAAYLAYRSAEAPTLPAVLGIIVCAGLGVAVGVAPFILDYARQQDLQMRDRERIMESLVRSTASAADQASIAANGLNEIAEATKFNLKAIESLPAQVQEARNQALKANRAEATKGLDEARSEIAALGNRITELDQQLKTQSEALNQKLEDGLAALNEAVKSIPPAAAPIKEESPERPKKTTAKAKSKPPPEPVPTLFDAGDTDEASVAPATEGQGHSAAPAPPQASPQPPRKKRARKTKATVVSAPPPADEPVAGQKLSGASSEEPSDSAEPEPKAVSWDEPISASSEPEDDVTQVDEPIESSPPLEDPEVETPAAAAAADPEAEILDEPAPEEPSLSADGNTRLTVTAYIGIGNRLFIRGDGPGLSPDEGVPLQFVSIGKWRWETDSATGPMKVTLWKNDEEQCAALGEIDLKPGTQLETTATF